MSELFNLQQTGGRLLGKGAYGCTFEPLPPCAGGDVFKRADGGRLVGKVTAVNVADELTIGRTIMAINPSVTPLYFALPTEKCRPSLPIRDPEADRCAIIKGTAADAHLSMLIMPAAGEPLDKLTLYKERAATNYLAIFRHLLEGMILYQDAGFVHNDIHMSNVLVDERNVARYIDFGLAFRPADVKDWDDTHIGRKFKPKFIWMSPELQAWRMYKSGVRLRDGAQQLYEHLPVYRLLERLQGAAAPLHDILQSVISDIRSDVDLVRKYGKRFDSWRIGICMYYLWDDLIHWSGLMHTSLWKESRERVRLVIAGLTAFDVRRRMTARQALLALDPTNRIATTPEPSGDGGGSSTHHRVPV